MSEKYKKTCKYLNYTWFKEHLLTLASAVTGCVSIFAFSLLVAIFVGITCTAVGIQICAITVGIKKI